MKTPYSYQFQCLTNIDNFFEKRNGVGAVLVTQPTGTGKTVIFSHFAKKEVEAGRKVLVLTDRAELQGQSGNELIEAGLIPFNISAGVKYVPKGNVFVAMIQTLRNRLKDDNGIFIKWITEEIDTIIIDETHIQDFNPFFKKGLHQNKRVVGLTATPRRSGKMRQLGIDYNSIIEGITVKTAIEQGYLVNCDYYDTGSPDMSDVGYDSKSGDFMRGLMFAKFDNTTLYGGVVNQYIKLTPDTKSLIFCVNQMHAIKTALEFEKAGADVKYIVSGMSEPISPKDNEDIPAMVRYEKALRQWELLQQTKHLTGNREEVFDWFAKSKPDTFTVFINVDIATKGYNCINIQTIILNLATLSLTKFLQMLGRGGRTAPNKTHFNVLDFGNNRERHGNYDDNHQWGLWHEESQGGGVAPIKECGISAGDVLLTGAGLIERGCFIQIPVSATLCPFCGFEYPVKKKGRIEKKLAISNRPDDDIIKPEQMTVSQLVIHCNTKGYNNRYLAEKLKDKGGNDFAKKELKELGLNRVEIERLIGN